MRAVICLIESQTLGKKISQEKHIKTEGTDKIACQIR